MPVWLSVITQFNENINGTKLKNHYIIENLPNFNSSLNNSHNNKLKIDQINSMSYEYLMEQNYPWVKLTKNEYCTLKSIKTLQKINF